MNDYRPSQSELDSFNGGMIEMYDFARSVKPDIAIFPLRGAQPFSAAYKRIAELRMERKPKILLLPLGTFTDVHTKAERGPTTDEKADIITAALDNYFNTNPGARRILLVDEVMNGGTILTHHQLIRAYLRERKLPVQLRVCAIEDGKRNPRGKYQSQAERRNFHRVRVRNLFVMDRPQYLPKVIRNGHFSVEIEQGKLEDVLEHLETVARN